VIVKGIIVGGYALKINQFLEAHSPLPSFNLPRSGAELL
jgi:hypothetical protein